MKKLAFSFLLICFGITQISAQRVGLIKDSDGYTNIRLAESGKSDIVGIIISGQSFRFYPNTKSEWWKVEFEYRTGYVHKTRIVDLETITSEISVFFQSYFAEDRNNAELSEGLNEKLFLLTQEYPLAALKAYYNQSEEIKSFLISMYETPVHDLIDLQLIYSRLISIQDSCSKTIRIINAINIAAKKNGLILKNTAIDFTKIPEYNKPNARLFGVNKNFTSEINEKPITYYINNPNIDIYAKMFYQGQFGLFDNAETFSLIDLVFTENTELQPFYFYIFNSIVSLSDGALSEIVSGYCVRFLKYHPCDFFEYQSTESYNIPLDTWTMFIAFDLYTKEEYNIFVKAVELLVNNNCSHNKKEWINLKNKILQKTEY